VVSVLLKHSVSNKPAATALVQLSSRLEGRVTERKGRDKLLTQRCADSSTSGSGARAAVRARARGVTRQEKGVGRKVGRGWSNSG